MITLIQVKQPWMIWVKLTSTTHSSVPNGYVFLGLYCNEYLWWLNTYTGFEDILCQAIQHISGFSIDLYLTHWDRVTHTCVSKLTVIGSDNGFSPRRRQAIIWTIAGILLIGPLGTNFSELLIGIQIFSFKNMHLKMSSAKWRRFVSASIC